jgi:hypothetical protein
MEPALSEDGNSAGAAMKGIAPSTVARRSNLQSERRTTARALLAGTKFG